MSVELYGSHTSRKWGDAVRYQGRKACNTSYTLFLPDNQGIMISMPPPQQRQHHDLFAIQKQFDEICGLLKAEGINLKGLFLNTDADFILVDFKTACDREDIIANMRANFRNSVNSECPVYESGAHDFDDQFHVDHSVIEHTNAWLNVSTPF